MRDVLYKKGSVYLGLTHGMFFCNYSDLLSNTHPPTHKQRHTIHTGINRLTHTCIYYMLTAYVCITLNNLLTIKQAPILPTPPLLWEKRGKTSKSQTPPNQRGGGGGGGFPTMHDALTHFNLLFPFNLPRNIRLGKGRKGEQYVEMG